MFHKPESQSKLDREINRVMIELNAHEVNSPEYVEVLKQLSTLMKLRTEEKSPRISAEAVLTSLTYLAGIFMIVRHEHTNVITSKAMSFVPRPK